MVLPRGLAVLALLPAVAVAAVAHLLAGVEQHRAALRPERRKGDRIEGAGNEENRARHILVRKDCHCVVRTYNKDYKFPRRDPGQGRRRDVAHVAARCSLASYRREDSISRLTASFDDSLT